MQNDTVNSHQDSSVQSAEKTAIELTEQLQEQGIRAISLSYIDNSGVSRMKGIPTSRLKNAAMWGVGMSPVFDTFLLNDGSTYSASAGGPVGDIRMFPDLTKVTPLAGELGWAWAPVDRFKQTGQPHEQCQRQFLKKMIQEANAQGYELSMAFEIEWMLSQEQSGVFKPLNTSPAYSHQRITEVSRYSVDLLDALAKQGIDVEQLHPEYSPGQFELSIRHSDPLTAADLNILVRQTIRAIGLQHQMHTTFSPCVVDGGVGNGCHLHLSLNKKSNKNGYTQKSINLFQAGTGPEGITQEGEYFISGILNALPSLLAITAPSVASYLRLIPHHWSGNHQCWGVENREAAIRFIKGSPANSHNTANIEIKTIDATANPYLVIGCIIAHGLAGLKKKTALPAPVNVDPATLTVTPNKALKGVKPLPTQLQDSLAAFKQDSILQTALGKPLFETLIAIRTAEIALFKDSTTPEIIAETCWRH
ncbi:glutamine synthetase family protein [uncultured Shewanella sp.]|uniref:glutamine synthetase family protein n=1 Tax=uncultured Shewanella sp. TaxID=173975 RepID=UPI002607CD37|nr:glutamine synthetase family protein [uncultured Shewanella sp.]